MIISEIDNVLLTHPRQPPSLEVLAICQIFLPRRRPRTAVDSLLCAELLERSGGGAAVGVDDGAVFGVAAGVFAFQSEVKQDGANERHL